MLGKYQEKGTNHQVRLAIKEYLIFEVNFNVNAERCLYNLVKA